MKTRFLGILYFSFALLFLNCSENKKKVHTSSPIIKEEIFEIPKTENSTQKIPDKTDCIFDTSTQNDSFLKGIDDLKGYSWNTETKTASLRLSKTEVLEIYRGGCDQFSLKATFTVPKKITLEKNQKYIFDKILWVSELIYDASEYKIIEESLTEDKYAIDKTNPERIHINLMDQKIYNSFVIYYDSYYPEYNTFSIEYFLN